MGCYGRKGSCLGLGRMSGRLCGRWKKTFYANCYERKKENCVIWRTNVSVIPSHVDSLQQTCQSYRHTSQRVPDLAASAISLNPTTLTLPQINPQQTYTRPLTIRPSNACNAFNPFSLFMNLTTAHPVGSPESIFSTRRASSSFPNGENICWIW